MVTDSDERNNSNKSWNNHTDSNNKDKSCNNSEKEMGKKTTNQPKLRFSL